MNTVINEIIIYIEQVVLPDLTQKNDQPLRFHLSVIKSILKQSNPEEHPVDIGKIHEALHYIETIKIEMQLRFFSRPETIGQLLAENKEPIMSENERKQLPYAFAQCDIRPAVAAKDHTVFGIIHSTLREEFQNYLKFVKDQKKKAISRPLTTAWTFTYPTNENGEVMNQDIGTWQAMVMPPYDDPNKAYNDFTRDISIRGMRGKTEKDAENLVQYLVRGGNYTHEEEAVIKWLTSNGGQENNRFIDLLMMSGVFTNDRTTSNLRTESIEQNWALENGKIVFNCDAVSYALLIDGDAYVNNAKMKLEKTDVENISSKHPLLRIQANIELSIDEHQQVKPRIVNLKTTSFSKDLTSPARLYAEHKETPKFM